MGGGGEEGKGEGGGRRAGGLTDMSPLLTMMQHEQNEKRNSRSCGKKRQYHK